MTSDLLRFFFSLTTLTFLPLVGAGVVMLLRIFLPQQKMLGRNVALLFSLITLVQAVGIFYLYANRTPEAAVSGTPFVFAFQESATFFPLIGSQWHVGIDGLSA